MNPVTVCTSRTNDERTAEHLMEILTNEDPQSAQFALDSLRLIRDAAIPILVCHLTDETRLETPEPINWLLRPPHFELIAHYKPETIGAAVAIILGAPRHDGDDCNDESPIGRARCQAAWRRQLSVSK